MASPLFSRTTSWSRQPTSTSLRVPSTASGALSRNPSALWSKPSSSLLDSRKEERSEKTGLKGWRSFARHIRKAGSKNATFALVPLQLENTYQLTSGYVLRHDPVRCAIRDILRTSIADIGRYEPNVLSTRAPEIADKIKYKVRETLETHRHRVIAHVVVAQLARQKLYVASRALWDPREDNHVSVAFSDREVLVIAVVYFVYYP